MSEMALVGLSQPQAFDTEQFGRPVVRLLADIAADGGALAGRLAHEIDNWRRQGVWLASVRLPEARAEACEAELAAAGFRRIETLVSFERPTAAPPPADHPVAHPVALAARQDWPETIEIARTAFRYDRYHADPLVPKAGADRLKAAWVANSLAGRADAVLLAKRDGRVAGFVTLMATAEAAAIDLIATAPWAQGRGIGRALVAAALARYAEQRPLMRGATQADNLASQRLYRGAGFVETARQATYHRINTELPA